MVTATTLLPQSIVHGPTTPAAGKKNPAQTEPKAEFSATPIEQTLTTEESTQQGQHMSQSEQHRATNFDGTEVLVTRQEGGVEHTNSLPPEHSKKLKLALADTPEPLVQEPTKPMLPFDIKV